MTQIPGYLFMLPWRPGPIGGVNAVVRNLYRALAEGGRYRPAVLFEDWGTSQIEHTVEDGMELFRLQLRSPVLPDAPLRSAAAYIAGSPVLLSRLAKFLRERRIEVINAHYPTLAAYSFLVLKRLGLTRARLVLSFHGSDVSTTAQTQGIERHLWNSLLQGADAIVACSKALARRVSRLADGLDEKIRVVHNGLDVRAFHDTRDVNFELPDSLRGRPFVLSVAAFEFKKGHDVLLPAFAAVAKQLPDLALVLIGQVGPDIDQIKALIRRYDLERSCHLLTNVPPGRVCRYLEEARLFVLASRSEPFGLAVLEAGAHALPVVASRIEGIPEIISSDELGTLVEADNVEQLKAAMLDMLVDFGRARACGENLRRHVLHEFTWERAYQEYLQYVTGMGDTAVS